MARLGGKKHVMSVRPAKMLSKRKKYREMSRCDSTRALFLSGVARERGRNNDPSVPWRRHFVKQNEELRQKRRRDATLESLQKRSAQRWPQLRSFEPFTS